MRLRLDTFLKYRITKEFIDKYYGEWVVLHKRRVRIHRFPREYKRL